MRLDPFHRRLDPAARRPVAVAVSGGGDSIQALRLTAAWAQAQGRPVAVLYVDHGLQSQSQEWARFVARAAHDVSAAFEVLTWTAAKPATGLAAAARRARHALLADAARRLGARVLVTGHTGDDALENAALGQGVLSEWSPSPVWPQGRDVFILRPLLGLRRADIRRALAADGVAWIDDPSNDNPRQPRIAARLAISADAQPMMPPIDNDAPIVALARAVAIDDGALSLPRAALVAAPMAAQRKVLAAALVSAGGGEATPRGHKLDTLLERLTTDTPFTATLAGARLSGGETVRITREVGDAKRAGLRPLRLAAGETGVWDGRYEIMGTGPSAEIQALKGLAASLPAGERERLRTITPAARPGLPVFVENGVMTCPILAQQSTPGLKPLVRGRFLAACGVTARECDLDTPRAWR